MKGIMFKEDLFEAIVAGKKTMTRRVINPQPPEGCEFIGISEEYPDKKIGFYWSDTKKGMKQGFWPSIEKNLHPKYQPDEIVYLKEPICFFPDKSDWIYKYDYPEGKIEDEITGEYHDLSELKWENKMYMPAKYARYFIQIKKVRVQRLDDISEDDAKAEGVDPIKLCKGKSYKQGFLKLFEKINGHDKIKFNPWVWVYKFELIENFKIEN